MPDPDSCPGNATPFAPPPAPRPDRHAWMLALALAACGLLVLLAALLGALGSRATVAPPAVPYAASTPSASASATAGPAAGAGGAVAGAGSRSAAALAAAAVPRASGALEEPVSSTWMEGFYPIYATAQSTFGVNWLLIASIHRQETAFSTARGTYHGLNFAGCCGGPMQFNVRNGRVTTWDLVSSSYRYGARPASYLHRTAVHPSIYDDFDAIMAGAHLLSADGAGLRLDAGAWGAAYDYYGHDANGVSYADEVIARAIGWSQHGFCASCATDPTLLAAVHAAYGAPVLAALLGPRTAPARARAARRAGRG